MSFPLFWMISSSLKTLQETNSPGIFLVPAHPTLAGYISIFHKTDFLRSYFNSVFNTNLTVQQWPTIMTAAVLTTVPLFVIFFFAQRHILESVVISGLKG